MRFPVRSASVVIAALTTVGAAAQTKLQCADNPTSMRNVSTNASGAVLSTTNYTCGFNRAALAINCQVSTAQASGGVPQTTRMTYASVDDYVDQFVVTPHLQRAQKLEIRGMGGDRDTTYTYDAKKRLIREDITQASGRMSLVWNEWDAAGRPTKGTWSSSTGPVAAPSDSIAYDDNAKTVKRMAGGQVAIQLETELYKNGNQTVTMSTTNGYRITSTMTTLASEKICR